MDTFHIVSYPLNRAFLMLVTKDTLTDTNYFTDVRPTLATDKSLDIRHTPFLYFDVDTFLLREASISSYVFVI